MSGVLEIVGLCAQSSNGRVLRDVSLSVGRGEVMALVGESGAGKTTIAKAILDILPPAIRITSGQILFGGKPLGETAGG